MPNPLVPIQSRFTHVLGVYSEPIEIAAVTSISFYLSHHTIKWEYLSHHTLNGNIYFYWNYYIYRRRHEKLFTNCPVLWDTLYIVHKLFCIVGYPVYCSQTVLYRGIPCILFTNCPVSWDTLYIVHKLSCFVGYPVYWIKTKFVPRKLMIRRICTST